MSLQKNFRENHSVLSRINITNLVDVALTLVIILLMIAPLIEQGIEVKLPATSPGKISVEESIIVTVAPGEVYYIGREKVKLRQLYQTLKEEKTQNPQLSVIVKGDEKVLYRDLIKVLDIAKKCKINMIGLATRTE